MNCNSYFVFFSRMHTKKKKKKPKPKKLIRPMSKKKKNIIINDIKSFYVDFFLKKNKEWNEKKT